MEILKVTMYLKKAKLWDVFHHGFEKRIGQPYWVRSSLTGKCDNKSYIIEKSTNARELKNWVDMGMLYVPASDLDLKKNNINPAPQVQQGKQLAIQ